MAGFFFFFDLFAISWVAPVAYGGSQARGLIGAVAASLCQSHSNAGSEPCLQPTPQLMAMPDPTEQGQGLNPQPHGSQSDLFPLRHNRNPNFLFFLFFCLFTISWAAPAAYGGSQARGLIGAVATGLRQSHRNEGSKPRL